MSNVKDYAEEEFGENWAEELEAPAAQQETTKADADVAVEKMSKDKAGVIVGKSSSAHNYNYTSLADLHRANIEIPKMKTMVVEGKEYVYYYDKVLCDWVQGARVVIPEMKGCNIAQAYGAALTYARRYTVQLAMSVACDDDEAVEIKVPQKQQGRPEAKRSWQKPANERPASKKQIEFVSYLMQGKGYSEEKIAEGVEKLKTAADVDRALTALRKVEK